MSTPPLYLELPPKRRCHQEGCAGRRETSKISRSVCRRGIRGCLCSPRNEGIHSCDATRGSGISGIRRRCWMAGAT